MKKVLAFIPARGGSKGILGKNIVEVGGKPLIAWTIEAALKSAVCDRVIVSTDDSEIAAVAKKYGAEIPWLRPSKLAQDDSAIIDCMIYELDRLKSDQDYVPDFIMLLQATSPLRTFKDIKNAVHLQSEKSASSVLSVCEAPTHPYLMKKVDQESNLSSFMTVPMLETKLYRQNLPTVYVLNGAIYLLEVDMLLKERSLYGDRATAYIMPVHQSHDIDTHLDLSFIDMLINRDPVLG